MAIWKKKKKRWRPLEDIFGVALTLIFFCIVINYPCTNFHAFIIKCTIFSQNCYISAPLEVVYACASPLWTSLFSGWQILNVNPKRLWAVRWDFQQFGMCAEQRLRPACGYWSEPLLVTWIFYDLSCWPNNIWSLWAWKEAAQVRLSLHLSKCLIVGNHASRLIYQLYNANIENPVLSTVQDIHLYPYI